MCNLRNSPNSRQSVCGRGAQPLLRSERPIDLLRPSGVIPDPLGFLVFIQLTWAHRWSSGRAAVIVCSGPACRSSGGADPPALGRWAAPAAGTLPLACWAGIPADGCWPTASLPWRWPVVAWRSAPRLFRPAHPLFIWPMLKGHQRGPPGAVPSIRQRSLGGVRTCRTSKVGIGSAALGNGLNAWHHQASVLPEQHPIHLQCPGEETGYVGLMLGWSVSSP